MSKPTLEQLEVLNNIKESEEKRVSLSIKNLICPECGSKLHRVEEKHIIYRNNKFWSIILGPISYSYTTNDMQCSKDSSHHKYDIDWRFNWDDDDDY